MTNKTFEVVEDFFGNKEIRAFENGRRILDITLDDYTVNGAVKVLEGLGYQLLYRAY